MQSTTLIQLISAQAMQNLLPALAFDANEVFEIHTPSFESKLGLVCAASQAAGHKLVSQPVLLSKMPGIEETRSQVANIIRSVKAAGSLPIVNFTGATKLMSIGAWQAAKDADALSVYVDTQTAQFIDGGTSKSATIGQIIPGSDLSFGSVSGRLTVDSIAASNGVVRVTSGRDDTPFSELARVLLSDVRTEQASWDAIRGRGGFIEQALGHGSYGARDANQCFHLLETAVRGLPASVTEAALEANLFEETKHGLFISANASGRDLFAEADHLLSRRFTPEEYRRLLFALREAIDFPINFLTGAWIEAAVAAKMRSSSRFHDVRWSVNVGEQDGYDLEEDIVAVSGVQLAFVSCKRSDRLLAHAEEVDARARRIGGQFTSRYYVIHRMPTGQVFQDLQQRCKELGGIQLISTQDLANGNPFLK